MFQFQSILTVQNTATQNTICNILQWRWENWNKGILEMLVSNFRTTSRTCYSIQYRWKFAPPPKKENILQICATKTALQTFPSTVQQTKEYPSLYLSILLLHCLRPVLIKAKEWSFIFIYQILFPLTLTCAFPRTSSRLDTL